MSGKLAGVIPFGIIVFRLLFAIFVLFFKMSGTVVSGVSIIHVLDCAQVLILM